MQVGSREVFITFRVEASDYFQRKGADIHTDAKISFAQVISKTKYLGVRIKIVRFNVRVTMTYLIFRFRQYLAVTFVWLVFTTI